MNELDFSWMDSLTGEPEREPMPTNKRLQAEINEAQDEKRRAAAVYTEYQDNVKKTAELTAQLRQGIGEGTNIYHLMFIALEIIGRCRGDKTFSEAEAQKMVDIYGTEEIQAASRWRERAG